MIDYNLLAIQNPWWQNKEEIKFDPKIREYENSLVKYSPRQILDLKLKPGAINIVFGPRQTGKSTAIKLLIKEIFEKGYSAEQLLYFNCDAVNNRQQLIDLVIKFLEGIKTEKNSIPENYLFLDEVSSVPKWPFAIKWLTDAGLLEKSKIILTGSSSINLIKSGEYMPGRRKGGKDIRFLPVSFTEYFRLIQPDFEVPKKIQSVKNMIRLQQKLIRKRIKIEKIYQDFLLTGGFLKLIDLSVKKMPYTEALELYLGTLKSEMAKFGRKEISSRQILRKIIASLTAETSYSNIAEEAELGSKNTAVDYLNFFSNSFLLNEVLFYSIPQKKVVIKKNKKFYPIDPFLLWVFQGFVTGSNQIKGMYKDYLKPPLSSRMAELFVASELYKQDLEHFYYKYKDGRELDFFVPKQDLAIEVKYKNKVTFEDLKGLKCGKRKILVSKDTLEKRNNILIIPVHLFGFLT